MKRLILAVGSFLTSKSAYAVAQEESEQLPEVGAPTREVIDQVLEFLYTAAHWIGKAIADVLQSLLPSLTVPPTLVDSIGFLALITVLLLIMKVAERVAWIVISIGWLLIVVRLVLIATDTSL